MVNNESSQMKCINTNDLSSDNEVCLSDNDDFVDVLSDSLDRKDNIAKI